jgi:hypothetical protein
LLKKIASTNISNYIDEPIYSGLPFVLNLPYSSIGSLGLIFNITTCDQWYLYNFEEDATLETRKFWGKNDGYPIFQPDSYGMLDGDSSIM